MTDTLHVQETRAVMCGRCGWPTGDIVKIGEMIERPYCDNCADLPRPWTYDEHSGETTIGPRRVNINEPTVASPLTLRAVVVRDEDEEDHDDENTDQRTPTCECGSTRFRAFVTAWVRVRQEGFGPYCDQDDDCEGTVFIESYPDDITYEERIETDDTRVEHVECYECGRQWPGEWDYC